MRVHKHTPLKTTPKDLEIQIRPLDHQIPDDLPRYWANNDPFFTHFLNALSTFFPEGERFFIQSVRHFQNQITDPVLQHQIKAFIKQEANHSRAHQHYNHVLFKQGYHAIAKYEQIEINRVKRFSQRCDHDFLLAVTVAAEHFTAMLAHQALIDFNRLFKNTHPAMKKLWYEHAVEETEHKSVAFDVYQIVCSNLRMRRRAFIIFTVDMLLRTFARHCYFLAKDGKLFDLKLWLHGINLLYGKHGLFRLVAKKWLAYFRADFHPWEIDNRYLIKNALPN